MTIKEILGAEDFPEGTRYPTYQVLGKGLMPTTAQGVASANMSVAMLNGRQWFKIVGVTTPSMTYNLSSAKITLDEMKTKKIYGGYRYCVPNNAVTKTVDRILQFILTGATGTATYTALTESDLIKSTDEVYIKWCLDIPGMTITVWMDGVLVKTTPLTFTAITNFSDVVVNYGQGISAGSGEGHHYNDFYWEVDNFAVDGEVAGALGAVRVRSVKLGGSVLPQGWTVSDGGTMDNALSVSGLTPTTELTPFVKTTADEVQASVGLVKPTTTSKIKAVSVEVFGYRDTGTTSNMAGQLRQGAVLGPKRAFSIPTAAINKGASSDRLGCLSKDLNGVAWTPDSIDALEVLINNVVGV